MIEFNELLGKTLSKVERFGEEDGQDKIVFTLMNGTSYELVHNQDCCESVYIESIVGNLRDLVGAPLLVADEVSTYTEDGSDCESTTWTFYKLATIKGYVDIRWVGTSNGYYSERVDFLKVED